MLIPNICAYNYLGEEGVYWSRFIDERSLWWRLDGKEVVPAPPTALMLFRDDNENMPIVVLDVADSEASVLEKFEW